MATWKVLHTPNSITSTPTRNASAASRSFVLLMITPVFAMTVSICPNRSTPASNAAC